ncbi:ABC transporter permease [Falsibacillus pallidus]|uniref:Monosaccharide ABC transporter membrane protein (CUT2 family) n=1 Tax=Falsibacillus pallidus TaxID=493781 RepID=A0A370GCJ4_9BACI|nr:ABC transporter permease [Falsibacillus pallidus]RDI41552.1 monosaccharide ABC transporter membrane protein (CUT2 family) [Falsibacillus pallidus]
MKEKYISYLFKYGAAALMAAVLIYFSLVNSHFLTYGNLTDILRSISIVTLLALGVTFTLIVNGFDLSVGSTMSLSTVITASLMVWYELPIWAVILLPIVVGAAVGLFNSLLIVKLKIPDLLATLGTMYVVAGLHRTYTEGYSIYNHMPLIRGGNAPGSFYTSFLWLGQGKWLGIPAPVIIMFVFVALVYIILEHTKWGRILYMTGGNEEAAHLSGVRVKKVKLIAYVVSGIFASLAGILFTARVGSGQIDAGSPLLMEAVAAVFVGFSFLGAGKPNVIGTFFGAALIGVLLNGLTMLNLPYYAFEIVKGSVLLLALAVTYVYGKRK